MTATRSPYGGGPGAGISLPPYYRPTPYVKSRNNFFPGVETLGPDEMRISFVGTSPFPPRIDQAGTSIMVELGNGEKFFFDFGPGCMRNIIGLGHHIATINDIFITHLHVDHYADIPYLFPFRAWSGGWMPLRVTGPSGRTPELGTQAMVDGMKQMLKWHLEAFDIFPIGDGYEIEVNEFDWKDENGICYDKNGVTVRHWPRSHAKDGASAYRLDWNGLSFVWTGDGRPDELTAKYAKGADVFVTELEMDTGRLMEAKYGMPAWLYNYTIDIHHTTHYATGKLISEVKPRAGMVTHFPYDDDLVPEAIAGIRAHWDGLFLWGAPDGIVVNVTKDAIWSRKAALPGLAGMNPPFEFLAAKMKDRVVNGKFVVPQPRRTREEQQEQYTRDIEMDPRKYMPEDVRRELITHLPDPLEIDLAAVRAARARGVKKDKAA